MFTLPKLYDTKLDVSAYSAKPIRSKYVQFVVTNCCFTKSFCFENSSTVRPLEPSNIIAMFDLQGKYGSDVVVETVVEVVVVVVIVGEVDAFAETIHK